MLRAATNDLRDALESGDGNDRTAAAAALMQTIGQLDPKASRDRLHISDDAGQYEAALTTPAAPLPASAHLNRGDARQSQSIHSPMINKPNESKLSALKRRASALTAVRFFRSVPRRDAIDLAIGA